MWYIRFNRFLAIYGCFMAGYNFVDKDYGWAVGYVFYAVLMFATANLTYRGKVRSARSEHQFQISIQRYHKIFDQLTGGQGQTP